MDTAATPDVRMLKALADERRLAIVGLLADGSERCSCVLASDLDMSEALVSHHVGRLRDVGLVETRREGRWLHVKLCADALDGLAASLGAVAADVREGCCDDTGCGCGVGREEE